MNKLYLNLIFCLLGTFASAQTLNPLFHPKFQNPVPFPTKINVGATTTTMKMGQTTQWLGLVGPHNTPLQTTVWGYGLSTGAVSYPGPTLVANSNSVANIEWQNALPQTHLLGVDSTYHQAVAPSGIPTVVHVHGAHVEDVSDGMPEAWYTNNYATKGPDWVKKVYSYENTQEAATLWYHDHALGITRLNVYAGLAGFYLVKDANDLATNLPRGNYDRELIVQDKMFTSTGQLYLPTSSQAPNGGVTEFFGDFILVNGMIWPYMNVEPRKYRLRLVNGSDSRRYKFSLSNNASFLQIGTDGGKLNKPVSMTNLTMMPGERAEIIVDFSTMNGQNVKILNSGPDAPILSFFSNPFTTGQIMEFRVNQPLNTTIAEPVVTTTTNLRPTLGPIADIGPATKTRKLGVFAGTDDLGRIWSALGIIDPTSRNNGSLAWHDPVTENVNLNDTEIWEIYNPGIVSHAVHLHLIEFQILSKQTFSSSSTSKMQMLHNGGMATGQILSNIVLTGSPTTFTPAQSGWKDTYNLPPGEMVRIKARFDKAGEYVWHCHILSHEDHDMMRKLIVRPIISPACAVDTIAPVFVNCPTNIAKTTITNCAATTWTPPTVTDNCSTPTVSFTTSPTTGLTNGGCFPIGTTTVNYMMMDDQNNMSECSFKVVVISAPLFSNCTGGLAGTYYNNTTLTAPAVLQRTENINFSWGWGSPGTGVNNDFSTRWEGQIFAPMTGTYTFKTTTDDGLRLWINNQLIIDKWVNQSATSWTGTINLVAGQKFPFKMEYADYGFGAQAQLFWSYPGQAEQIVPAGFLCSDACTADIVAPIMTACPTNRSYTTTGTTAIATWTAPTATDNCTTPSVSMMTSPTLGLVRGGAFPIGTTTVVYSATDAKNNTSICSFNVVVTSTACTGGLVGTYYNNPTMTPPSVLQRTEIINFNWGWGHPATGVNADNFSVRWEGQIFAPVTGTYTFKTTTDDGLRLWVNNQLIIDKWVNQSATSWTGTINLVAGQKLPFKMEYVDYGFGAQAQLFWSYPGQVEQIVPTGFLCSVPVSPLVSTSQGLVSLVAKAESNRTILSWVSNINGHQNDNFIVQKLNAATQVFEDIARVTNTNMNQDFASFTYCDKTPTEGDNTYRIKAILVDGSMKISENRIVNFKDLTSVRIFPNPANDVLNIDLTSYKKQTVNIYLYNTLGQQKLFKQFEQLDNTLVELDMTNMTVGTYMVRITSKNKREVVKPMVITH